MAERSMFLVMPYLRTRDRLRIRGIEFRSSRDLGDLSTDVRDHLTRLCGIFFLQDGVQIDDLTCSHVEVPDGDVERATLIRHVYEAQLLIAYLYSSPHSSGGVFLPFECSSLFQFQIGDGACRKGMVAKCLVWEEPTHGDRVKRVDEREIPKADLIPGYAGTRNQTTHLWVAEGSRVYPELPHLTLNLSQELSANVQIFLSHSHTWALGRLYSTSAASQII